MHLSIHSLNKTLFDGNAEKIIAKTTLGEITVLNNHLPLLAPLRPSAITVIDQSGKKSIFNIASGFLEIKPESEVIILAHETQ